MADVSTRELRNQGGRVVDRAMAGERVTVLRGGKPVAELGPLSRQPLSAEALLGRWRQLPPVDPARVRADLDAVIDPRV